MSLRRDVVHSWLRISGYTQAQLARALDISEGRISQLLSSRREEPSARLVAALISVTNLPFERLFSLQPDPKIIEKRMKQLAQRRHRPRHSPASAPRRRRQERRHQP